jgi:gamma-butyrobetaine dioxygenase
VNGVPTSDPGKAAVTGWTHPVRRVPGMAVVADLPDCSVVPQRTADPAEALALLWRDGASILTGVGPAEDDARQAAMSVLGAHVLALPEPAAVREIGGDKDRSPFQPGDALPLHVDGFAYGDHACDVFCLSCVRPGTTGGSSILVDAYRMLDALAAADPELHEFLLGTPVDHAEPDMRPAVSPLALRTGSGRLAVRLVPYVRPAPGDPDPIATAGLIERWREVCRAQTPLATRFTLGPGDLALVDNYRVMHGRDAFAGDRMLWRVWVWTDLGHGVPDGVLHSDSRYAYADGSGAG